MLCHNRLVVDSELYPKTRFLVSSNVHIVGFELRVVRFVDQISVLFWFKRTRLPSVDILNSEVFGSEIGAFLFAIHTGVIWGTCLYQIPRYYLGGRELLPSLTKPSSNLPPWEMMVMLPDRELLKEIWSEANEIVLRQTKMRKYRR